MNYLMFFLMISSSRFSFTSYLEESSHKDKLIPNCSFFANGADGDEMMRRDRAENWSQTPARVVLVEDGIRVNLLLSAVSLGRPWWVCPPMWTVLPV